MAAIHYHFESKENLYRSIIQLFGGTLFEAAARALKTASNLDEFRTRLEIFLTELAMGTEEKPDLAMLLHRDMQTHPELVLDVFERTFGRSIKALEDFVDAAKEKGIIALNPPTPLVVEVLLSQLQSRAVARSKLRSKLIPKSEPVSHQEWSTQLIDLLINGIRRR
jgi:AcrR family transcriptional regulator